MTTNPYESPKADLRTQPIQPPQNWRDYAPEYNRAIVQGLIIQGVLCLLSALVLDMGQMHRAFWVALLCQWAVVWMLLFRRPMNPTKLDLAIVRYGIVPIYALVVIIGKPLALAVGPLLERIR